MARINIEHDQFEEGLSKLKQLIAEETPLSEAIIMAARLYARLGLMDRSQELFRRYLELYPASLHEKFELGMTYFDLGDTQQALALWHDVLAEHATHPPTLYFSALAYSQEGARAEAIRALDILLKSAKTDNLYFDRGRELLASIEQGKNDSGISEVPAQMMPGFQTHLHKFEH